MTELARSTWPAVDPRATLFVPLGSTEQHGPHLPLDTDTRIALAVAERAASRCDGVHAPPLAYGASGEHAGFAGTLSIGTEALRVVVIELVRSARNTFDRVVLVNGHGGNHATLVSAVDQLVDEGHEVLLWWPRLDGDAHAGHTETSLLLAIAPESVRTERLEAGNTAPLDELMGDLMTGGVAAVSDTGVLGDPTGATAESGQTMLDALVDDLVEAVRAWRSA